MAEINNSIVNVVLFVSLGVLVSFLAFIRINVFFPLVL